MATLLAEGTADYDAFFAALGATTLNHLFLDADRVDLRTQNLYTNLLAIASGLGPNYAGTTVYDFDNESPILLTFPPQEE
jgi:hypothetical protein